MIAYRGRVVIAREPSLGSHVRYTHLTSEMLEYLSTAFIIGPAPLVQERSGSTSAPKESGFRVRTELAEVCTLLYTVTWRGSGWTQLGRQTE